MTNSNPDMTYKEFEPRAPVCKCGGRPLATSRAGGWTIDCEWEDAFDAMMADKSYCNIQENWPYLLFETREQAIHYWEMIQEMECLTDYSAHVSAYWGNA